MSILQSASTLSTGRWTYLDALLESIDYRGTEYTIQLDETTDNGIRIRVGKYRADTYHPDRYDWGYGGWYRVSAHATDSEVIQAVFGLFKAYEEHECRESFLYRGRRVFGPHIDVDALWDVCERLDARTRPDADNQQGERHA